MAYGRPWIRIRNDSSKQYSEDMVTLMPMSQRRRKYAINMRQKMHRLRPQTLPLSSPWQLFRHSKHPHCHSPCLNPLARRKAAAFCFIMRRRRRALQATGRYPLSMLLRRLRAITGFQSIYFIIIIIRPF